VRPVAAKLLKELRPTKKRNVVDLDAAREAPAELSQGQPDTQGLPPNHETWMEIFTSVSNLGYQVLSSKALRKLARRVEAAEEAYMPGGPPMSPVVDSVFVSWSLFDAPIGPRKETVVSILAEVGPAFGLRAEVIRFLELLGRSRMGVYRVADLGEHRVRLEDVATGQSVQARVPDDLEQRDAFWLVRLLPPILPDHLEDWVVWTTPYVLVGHDVVSEWTAYCQRAVDGSTGEELASRIDRHFKATDEPTRWLDYIMDGYLGVREDSDVIALHGVPDRPETLPHHPTNQDAELETPNALERVRSRLLALSDEEGNPERAAAIREGLGLAPEPLSPELDHIMRTAYRMYGRVDAQGVTALGRLQAGAATLPADERAALEALSRGWFSAFEVQRIRLDEGIQVLDVLKRRRLWIAERSATRGLDVGDVLAGWIMDEGACLRFEGALCRIPRIASPLFVEHLRGLRDQLARSLPKLGWKRRAGALASHVVPLLEWALQTAPRPSIVNFDGDEILLSTARYEVVDAKRVARRLSELFEDDGDGAFRALSGAQLAASITLKGSRLQIRCNSRRRLDETKALVEKDLVGAITHQADSFEDPSASLDEAWERRLERPAAEKPPPELPPEAAQAVRDMLLERMRRWIDEPIPLLSGKTPREAVRSADGRDKVSHLLFRQAQAFRDGPSGAGLDLDEVWRELGLTPPA